MATSMRDEPGTQREYETIFILRPDTNQEGITQVNGKVRTVIEQMGGKILKLDNWGKRKLAYEINDLTDGDYTLINFHADPTQIAELDRVLRITDALGRVVAERNVARGTERLTLDLSGHADGLYLVDLRQDDHRVVQRLLLER